MWREVARLQSRIRNESAAAAAGDEAKLTSLLNGFFDEAGLRRAGSTARRRERYRDALVRTNIAAITMEEARLAPSFNHEAVLIARDSLRKIEVVLCPLDRKITCALSVGHDGSELASMFGMTKANVRKRVSRLRIDVAHLSAAA